MKVNLVVASGVHEGKAIPVPGGRLLIGRDADCQLRPASPAVSKKHCAILIRDGKVFLKDLGSTNGTIVNDEVLTGEQELAAGDRVKVGPLDFVVQILPGAKSDSTPIPDTLQAAGAGLRAAIGSGAVAPIPAAAGVPAPPVRIPAASAADDADKAAAMMLAGDEDSSGELSHMVPDGSTVTEMPAVDAALLQAAAVKAAAAKKAPAESSVAANDILKKFFRRNR